MKKTTLSIAVAQAVLICGHAFAQTAAPAKEADAVQTIIVTGQRAAMQSAQKLKQNAEEIIDGVVAEEAGKLPDRSITEVLQRVVGVTIDRNRSRGDPEHFSVEGSGISVRGLTWGSSTLNGRESFSAGWPGRELSWGDVPPELMSAVIVHKNPPAQLIEGGVSGQVDLRTALPFDYKSEKLALSASGNFTELGNSKSPAVSGLYSKRWDSDFGQWGALIDLSANRSKFRNDTVQLDAYFPHQASATSPVFWSPKSASWRSNNGTSDRVGIYGALQWKNKSMESALTFFQSQYTTHDEEHALFTGIEDTYKVVLKNPVYDSNNVLQSATYTYPIGGNGANNFAAGGLGYSSNTGWSDGHSKSREIAWNAKWNINQSWSVQNDLQWVHATNDNVGANVSLNTFVPSMNVDLTTNPARITFDDAARTFLSDPAHYYLDHQMPQLGKADANLYAWKTDVKFKFDHDVLRDLTFGVRLTKRDSAKLTSSGTGWWSLAQPWNVRTTSTPGKLPSATDPQGWQGRGSFGYLSDPRYAALVPTTTADFSNFFNGKVDVPAGLVMPSMAYVKDMNSFAANNQILALQCADGNKLYGLTNDCTTLAAGWKPEGFDDASKNRLQDEKTRAAYAALRFGFEEWRFPLEGNVGVRVVHTDGVSHGYTVFKPSYSSTTPPSVPRFAPIDSPIDNSNSYVNVLPSLNLKLELSHELQVRFAFAKSMYRPSFADLGEYITLTQDVPNATAGQQNVNYTGNNTGNVKLKPIRSDNFDLSLEWNPGNGASLTAAVFHKKVRDIILKSAFNVTYKDIAGNDQDFVVTQPDNVAKGSVTGLELAGQTYFDHVPMFKGWLPEWAKGFGITANYTYLKSKQELYHPFNLKYCPANGSFNNSALNNFGCDTNGLPFNSMPLQYLSPNAYNLTFLYDKGPLSARLAYSWRSRFLQGLATNGTNGTDGTSADPTRPFGTHDVAWGLPTWQEATGQLDFGVDYKITDRLSTSFSASNLTDTVIKQSQQQTIGFTTRAWFEPGRSYRLAMRYSY
ncbi:MAG: TonB-dependent receptor [Massilia sp.]